MNAAPGCKMVFDDSLDWLCAQDASALNASERAVRDVVQRIAATA